MSQRNRWKISTTKTGSGTKEGERTARQRLVCPHLKENCLCGLYPFLLIMHVKLIISSLTICAITVIIIIAFGCQRLQKQNPPKMIFFDITNISVQQPEHTCSLPEGSDQTVSAEETETL